MTTGLRAKSYAILLSIGLFSTTSRAQYPVPYAVTALNSVALNNSLTVDAFDSSDPNYSTSGQYDISKRKATAIVFSGSSSTNAIKVNLARIFGSVGTAGGTVTLMTGAVGDLAYATNTANNGTIQPGHRFTRLPIYAPPVAVPYTSGADLTSGTYGGTNYDYVLYGGTNYFTNGSLTIHGGHSVCVAGGSVQLYVTGDVFVSGGGFIYMTPGTTLAIYVGGSFTIADPGIINSGNATNLVYYGLPTSTNSTYSSSVPFRGIVYAPQSSFSYGGSGGMYGAAVVSSLLVIGTNGLHFDENVARVTCGGVIDSPQVINTNLVFSFSTFSNQSYSVQQSFDFVQWLNYTVHRGWDLLPV